MICKPSKGSPIADVFVVRCESKKVMVEHFYMALGFHVQRFVHRRAGYEYRYISLAVNTCDWTFTSKISAMLGTRKKP